MGVVHRALDHAGGRIVALKLLKRAPSPAPVQAQSESHEVVLLATRREGRVVAVGGVILELREPGPASLDPIMLQAVADALHEAG